MSLPVRCCLPHRLLSCVSWGGKSQSRTYFTPVCHKPRPVCLVCACVAESSPHGRFHSGHSSPHSTLCRTHAAADFPSATDFPAAADFPTAADYPTYFAGEAPISPHVRFHSGQSSPLSTCHHAPTTPHISKGTLNPASTTHPDSHVCFDAASPRSGAAAPPTPHPAKGVLLYEGASPAESPRSDVVERRLPTVAITSPVHSSRHASPDGGRAVSFHASDNVRPPLLLPASLAVLIASPVHSSRHASPDSGRAGSFHASDNVRPPFPLPASLCAGCVLPLWQFSSRRRCTAFNEAI